MIWVGDENLGVVGILGFKFKVMGLSEINKGVCVDREEKWIKDWVLGYVVFGRREGISKGKLRRSN